MEICKWERIFPNFSSLSWLPVQYRIDFKLLVFVYKSLNGLAASYLSELSVHKLPRTIMSSDQSVLIVQRTRYKRRGNQAFIVAAPKRWNSLTLGSFQL